MSSLAWFRLLFLRQRSLVARLIPLLSKRSTSLYRSVALPTLTALPLWLIVRAANPVEYANESDRPKSKPRIDEVALRHRHSRPGDDRRTTRRHVRQGRVSEGL